MTYARHQIEKAVNSRGYTLAELTWEPIGPGAEKEGPSGGWWGRVEPDPSGPNSMGHDMICGYSWREVVEYVEQWLPENRRS